LSSIYIFCEVKSGGVYIAAQRHFEECILNKRDAYLVTPEAEERNFNEVGRVINIDFPKSIYDLRANFRFFLAIKKMQIRNTDVIFSHGIRSGFLVSLFSIRRVRILIHRHIGRDLSFAYKLFFAVSHIFFSKIYSVSRPEIFVKKTIFFPILSPFIVGRGKILSSSRSHTQEPKKNKNIRILWLSRLEYPKKPLVLVEALEKIDPDKYFVTFVGQGHYRDQIISSIDSKEINGQIIDEANPLDIISSHDAIVLISDFEGIPFVLQEAMFMNKIVLCSDLPGTRFLGADSFIYVNDENIHDSINSIFDDSKREFYQSLISRQWNLVRNELHSSYSELA
jgi:glycosyltransferase involved in cell wall biosynthesis